jgi:hypothetical protein
VNAHMRAVKNFLPLVKRTAYGGADVVEFFVLTRPRGPDPLAARGLPAVLARAGLRAHGSAGGSTITMSFGLIKDLEARVSN